MPKTRGMWPSTACVPSTRTIVPIPTGESIAVQKWNSCGVLGRRSVATTRPSGMTRRLEKIRARTRSCSADGAEELFAVANAVRHLVPAPIRKRDRGGLGEYPPRNLVGARAHGSGVLKFGGFHADQPPHRVVPRLIPGPEVRARHRRSVRRRDAEYARPVPLRKVEHRSERIVVGIQRPVALHDASRAARACDALAPADAAVHEQVPHLEAAPL